ncbi:MAG: response regulator [Rhodospirillales bacterium]|nr:response regulator [Rhodospirillales bacterium]
MEKFNLGNVSILIIDDYAPMRKILLSLFRELGINRLSQATGGREALKLIKTVEPDVIILDAIMEPMDGLEFTRKVRSGEAGIDPFVPIIMVSGQTELRHIMKARDAGVTEFLAKPISARAMYSRICSVISNPRPFIRTATFFGPDRRRRALPYDGADRRGKLHVYAKEEPQEGIGIAADTRKAPVVPLKQPGDGKQWKAPAKPAGKTKKSAL